jgi:integrase/recombinase XerC
MAAAPPGPLNDSLEAWAKRFLDHMAAAKPSAHTLAAYRADLAAVIGIVAAQIGCETALVGLGAVSVSAMRTAFAEYAGPRSAATVRRTWSAWNRFAAFLLTEGAIDGNPMQAVSRPVASKSLPRALPEIAVARLVAVFADGAAVNGRADDWPERDFALIALALLTGMRSAELRDADFGHLQPQPDAPGELRIHVRGKGRKDRVVHASPPLTSLLADYLETRAARFGATRRAPLGAPVWERFKASDPLFVNADGSRLTQGTLQYRVRRAFRKAGIDSERANGALTHALRHTFATTMAARPDVTIHTLARMLGHESIATTQRYTEAAGAATREAAATNPMYGLLAPG